MNFVRQDVDADWIHRFDETRRDFGIRDRELRCWTFEVPQLDWRVFNVVAPLSHALLFLRRYARFDRALQEWLAPTVLLKDDDPVLRKFRHQLRLWKIPARSHRAFALFGQLPFYAGGRFLPKYPKVMQFAHRLLSVAVPTAAAEATWRHLKHQVEEFGDRAIIRAGDGDDLTHERRRDSRHRRILIASPAFMTSIERSSVVVELKRLDESPAELETFKQEIPLPTKLKGLVDGWSFHEEHCEDQVACFEILERRIAMLSKLGWPHALDHAAQPMLGVEASPRAIALRAMARQKLQAYRSVWENPLASSA